MSWCTFILLCLSLIVIIAIGISILEIVVEKNINGCTFSLGTAIIVLLDIFAIIALRYNLPLKTPTSYAGVPSIRWFLIETKETLIFLSPVYIGSSPFLICILGMESYGDGGW